MTKKQEKPTPEYYTVRLEALVPVTLEYKILADSAEDALVKLDTTAQIIASPYKIGKMQLLRLKKLNAKVFKFGTLIMKHMRNY